MNRPLKIIAWIAAALVALVLLAAIVLPLVVDPNDFRDEIAQAVESRTGRELVIEGDLGLSVFPWLGVDIGKARLANAPFAGEAPMVSIEGASVGVRLLPLLARRLEVRNVALDGLRLNLYRGPEGTNWDSLAGESRAAGPAEATPAGTPPEARQAGDGQTPEGPGAKDEGAAFDAGRIGGIRLRDARVSYTDKVDGMRVAAALGNFTTGAIRLEGESVSIEDLGLEAAEVEFEDAAQGTLTGSVGSLSAGALSSRPGALDASMLRLERANVAGTGQAWGDFKLRVDGLEASNLQAAASVVEGVEVTGLELDYEGARGKVKAALERLAAASLSGGGGHAVVSRLTLRKASADTSGEMGDWRVGLDNLETVSLSTGPGAPEIGESNLAGLRLARGGAGGFEVAAERLETGGITTDPARLRIAGLDLREGSYRLDLGEQGRLSGTIPELTIGALQPGTNTPIKGHIGGSWGDPEVIFDARLDGSASLDGSVLGLSGTTLELNVHGKTVPTGTQQGRIALSRLSVDTEAQTLALEGLEARIAGLSLNATAAGSRVLDDPSLEGSLRSSEFSPRKLMETLGMTPPRTTDPAVLDRASLEGEFGYAGGRLNLPSLSARLDDTQVSGRFSFAPGEPAVIRSSLQVNGIDLDRYLPPASEAAPGAEGEAPVEIPTEALKGLDVEADLAMGWVRVAGVRMTDVRARALVKGGVLTVDPLSAGLYDGRVNGRLAVDGSGPVPRVTLDQRLESVKLGPLVTDLAEVSRIQGTANLSLNATGTGATSTELLQALAGQMNFNVQDGVLTGINLVHALQSANALLKGNAVPEKTGDDTRFQSFGGSARFQGGRMVNDDLKVSASALQVTGQGSVGLVQHEVDYQLRASVPRGEAATGAGLADLAGSTIPVRITGSLSSMSVRPDLSGVIRSQAESLLRKKLGLDKEPAAPATGEAAGTTGEEAQQATPEQEQPAEEEPKSVEDALKDEARKKLKDLFGG